MRVRLEYGLAHLAQVYVAVGRLAVAVHPQGQDEGQGQHAERQQGVHEHVEQGRHSGRRPDFHCRRRNRIITACQLYDLWVISIITSVPHGLRDLILNEGSHILSRLSLTN